MKNGWKCTLTKVVKFRDERDWAKYHTAKNLAAAIAIEAAELQEHFLWKTDSEIDTYLRNPSKHDEVADELADVVIFVLLLADRLELDVDKTVTRKIRKNAERYPVGKAKGNAKKYTELSS